VLQPSPIKRNLVLRFTKGGGARETIKDALIEEKRQYRDSRKEENFSVSDAASPSCPPRARCRLPSRSLPSVNPLHLIVLSDALDGGDLYQVPH
jgi:hypothetical protein